MGLFAPVEPMNSAPHFKRESCEIWAPAQFTDWLAGAVGEATGIPPKHVHESLTVRGG